MTASARRGLALFDLDSTLLPIDSDHAWGRFMVGLGWVDAEAFREGNDRFYADYRAGRLDIRAYVAFATAPLAARSEAECADAQRRFVHDVIAPEIRPEAVALVEHHRERGDLVAVVSATHDFIVRPIAALFGVEGDAVIATRLVHDAAGRPTGAIDGTASFREGKVARVGQWLAGRGERLGDFDPVASYSDSPNDLPMLEMATEPVATNPSPDLAAIAEARGWRVLHLFGSPPTPSA